MTAAPPRTRRPAGPPLVSLDGVGASYGTTTVLRDVDLSLRAGEITGLLGANGAGKSTLIKVLSGLKPEHPGVVRIDGTAVRLADPIEATRLGIATVHQRVADGIVPGLTVAENLVLDEFAGGSPTRRRGVLTPGGTLRRARAVIETLDLGWSDAVLRADAGRLGISDAQLLVLARVLHQRPRLLILDEPTSTLSSQEAGRLFALLGTLRDAGLAIIYVSHRFGEIDALADRVVVLRDGTIGHHATRDREARATAPAGFDWPVILRAMLGRDVELDTERRTPRRGSGCVVSVDGVRLLEHRAPISVTIRGGEVLGVVGLIGAGKTELAHGLAGVRRLRTGTMTLDGEPYAPAHPADAIGRGVVLVPEDRHAEGLFPSWTLARNVTAPFLAQLSRFAGLLSGRRERERGRQVIEALDVRADGPDTSVDELSGGNQQKVVVGRWLSAQPRLIVLDEPFRGVDLGARRDIGERLRRLAAGGAAVVLMTSDIEEALEVADRIVVLVEGRITLDRHVDETDHAQVVEAFLGDTTATQEPPDQPSGAQS